MILVFEEGEKNRPFIEISKREALSLIASLCNQILEACPNSGRIQLWSKDHDQSLTIAVTISDKIGGEYDY